LAEIDSTTAQASGALNAYAARQMCAGQVSACAALYAGPGDVPCTFNADGKLENAGKCGMKALLAFVNTVDTVKVAEGCEVALTNYLKDLCTPATGTGKSYPYECRLRTRDDIDKAIIKQQRMSCNDPSNDPSNDSSSEVSDGVDKMVTETVDKLMDDLTNSMDVLLANECEKLNGLWIDVTEVTADKQYAPESAFYRAVYGNMEPANPITSEDANLSLNDKSSPADKAKKGYGWGYCIQNTVRYQCEIQDENTGGYGYAQFNATTNTCNFSQEWYKLMCEKIGGYYEGTTCYAER
jgi:hypothetical protein